MRLCPIRYVLSSSIREGPSCGRLEDALLTTSPSRGRFCSCEPTFWARNRRLVCLPTYHSVTTRPRRLRSSDKTSLPRYWRRFDDLCRADVYSVGQDSGFEMGKLQNHQRLNHFQRHTELTRKWVSLCLESRHSFWSCIFLHLKRPWKMKLVIKKILLLEKCIIFILSKIGLLIHKASFLY